MPHKNLKRPAETPNTSLNTQTTQTTTSTSSKPASANPQQSRQIMTQPKKKRSRTDYTKLITLDVIQDMQIKMLTIDRVTHLFTHYTVILNPDKRSKESTKNLRPQCLNIQKLKNEFADLSFNFSYIKGRNELILKASCAENTKFVDALLTILNNLAKLSEQELGEIKEMVKNKLELPQAQAILSSRPDLEFNYPQYLSLQQSTGEMFLVEFHLPENLRKDIQNEYKTTQFSNWGTIPFSILPCLSQAAKILDTSTPFIVVFQSQTDAYLFPLKNLNISGHGVAFDLQAEKAHYARMNFELHSIRQLEHIKVKTQVAEQSALFDPQTSLNPIKEPMPESQPPTQSPRRIEIIEESNLDLSFYEQSVLFDPQTSLNPVEELGLEASGQGLQTPTSLAKPLANLDELFSTLQPLPQGTRIGNSIFHPISSRDDEQSNLLLPNPNSPSFNPFN